jgi:hypothetical protein
MEFGETLVAITAILIGGAVVLIPLVAFATRFALKPLMETWSRARFPQSADAGGSLERRMALLEEQVNSLERQNAQLLEDADFRMRLESTHSG